jgi:proteic killer suppression protein
MIRSFAHRRCELFFREGPSQWRTFETVAKRKLDMLDAATKLLDLRSPPGNRLETLKGDREGQRSIRVNDQFRVCFRWTDNGLTDVEIVDYN